MISPPYFALPHVGSLETENGWLGAGFEPADQRGQSCDLGQGGKSLAELPESGAASANVAPRQINDRDDGSRGKNVNWSSYQKLQEANARLVSEVENLNAICRALSHIAYVNEFLDSALHPQYQGEHQRRADQAYLGGPGW